MHKISNKEKRLLLDSLVDLKGFVLEGKIPDKDYGICGNLHSIVAFKDGLVKAPKDSMLHERTSANSYNFVTNYCVGWRGIELETSRPICDVVETYFEEGIWEGNNLTARLDLIDFLINKLEGELNHE